MPRYTSPTHQAMRLLRQMGWTADIVERWIAPARKRFDWCGFGDVIAVAPAQSGMLVLQITSPSNVSARVNKLIETQSCTITLRASNQVEVWGMYQDELDKAATLLLVDDNIKSIPGSRVWEQWQEAYNAAR